MTNLPIAAEQGGETVTASGAGFNLADALAGCLGEAAEIDSSLFRPGDREELLTSEDVAGLRRLDAGAVLGFSKAQIASRDRLNLIWDGWDRIPPASELAAPRHWASVRSFDGSGNAACPAFLCYARFGRFVHGDATLDCDSTGCAAGETDSMARTKAILELVERDCAGIWWNRGVACERVSRPQLEAAGLLPALHAHHEETDRRAWFLDISAFRSATVIAAISCRPDESELAIGFGAAFERTSALRSAYAEMVQSEVAIEAHEARREAGASLAAADRQMARWLRRANLARLPFLAGTAEMAGKEEVVDGTAESLLGEMASQGLGPVWFAGLTREDVGVPVVKAICEGLAHDKARHGCARLDALPPRRGWLATRRSSGRSDPLRLLV